MLTVWVIHIHVPGSSLDTHTHTHTHARTHTRTHARTRTHTRTHTHIHTHIQFTKTRSSRKVAYVDQDPWTHSSQATPPSTHQCPGNGPPTGKYPNCELLKSKFEILPPSFASLSPFPFLSLLSSPPFSFSFLLTLSHLALFCFLSAGDVTVSQSLRQLRSGRACPWIPWKGWSDHNQFHGTAQYSFTAYRPGTCKSACYDRGSFAAYERRNVRKRLHMYLWQSRIEI